MGKICLLSDTHWGIRNDSPHFIEYNKKFLDNIFFPYLKENNIKEVIHLGDLVDRRKYINFVTAKRLREDFLEKIEENSINMNIILGNHDVYYKNTLGVNALYELIEGKYNNIHIIDEPCIGEWFGQNYLLLPWICDENRDETFKLIGETDAQVVFGHLELVGFEMYKGSPASHGQDSSIFDKFDCVFSGHYHHRSTNGHIFYLGSHSEFTWSDYDDPRGFHIFDTETRQIKFIENPYKIFHKIWYNDEKPIDIDFSQYTGTIIKVIVQNKNDVILFDKFMGDLEKVEPIEVQVVEDHLNLNLTDDDTIIDEAESTLEILKKYASSYDSKNVEKKRIFKKLDELYMEALTLE